MVKDAFASTPPLALPSKLRKRVAADTPRDSGRQPDKCRRRTGTDALFALSDVVQTMNDVHMSVAGPSALPPTSPEHLAQAIRLVEDEEGECGMDVLMKAADLFERDTRTPIAYLAFTKREMRSTWLHRRLDRGAQEAALINLSMFPIADMNADM